MMPLRLNTQTLTKANSNELYLGLYINSFFFFLFFFLQFNIVIIIIFFGGKRLTCFCVRFFIKIYFC